MLAGALRDRWGISSRDRPGTGLTRSPGLLTRSPGTATALISASRARPLRHREQRSAVASRASSAGRHAQQAVLPSRLISSSSWWLRAEQRHDALDALRRPCLTKIAQRPARAGGSGRERAGADERARAAERRERAGAGGRANGWPRERARAGERAGASA